MEEKDMDFVIQLLSIVATVVGFWVVIACLKYTFS